MTTESHQRFLPSEYNPAFYGHQLSIYAALALDSYSRGLGAKVHLVGDNEQLLVDEVGHNVGDATIIANSFSLGLNDDGDRRDASVGFYAVAYLVGDEVVISYRGSDQLFSPFDDPDAPWDDMGTVNNIAAGNVDEHILLALEFYNQVEALAAAAGKDIVVTGHSLGGALAGTVASLKRTAGVMFDNTGFERVITTAMLMSDSEPDLASLIFNGETPWHTASASSLKTVSLTHDIAQFLRHGQVTPEDASLSLWGIDIDLFTNGSLGAGHIQALLAYRLLLEERYGTDTEWSHAVVPVISSLMSDTVAVGLGIEHNVWGNPASGVLKDMISQTIVGGEFGDSAARALTGDMQELGRAIEWGAQAESLGVHVAHYASWLAIHAVDGQFDGILNFEDATGLLHVDLSFETWGNFDDALVNGSSRDWTDLLFDGSLSESEMEIVLNGPGRIEYATYATVPIVGNFLASISGHADAVSSYTGTSANDIVQGSAHNEVFYLGEGDNQVTTGGGFDWVYGGTGHDTLSTGLVWADFDITVEADGTVLMVAEADTANPTVIVAKGVETFVFAGAPLSVGQLTNGGPTDISIDSIAGQAQHAGLTEGTYYGGAVIAQLGVTDPNTQDRFTWELVGNSADFFSIDQTGRITTNGTQMFDYEFWHQTVGNLPLAEWEAGNLTPGFENLIGTQYAISVKVTDAHGESRIENLFLYMQDQVNEAPSSFEVWHNQIHTHVANLPSGATQIHIRNVVDVDGGTNVVEIDPALTDQALLPYLQAVSARDIRLTDIVAAGVYQIGLRTFDATNDVRSQTQVVTIEVHENTAPTTVEWGGPGGSGTTPPVWWPQPDGQVVENPGYNQVVGFLDISDGNDSAHGGSGENYSVRILGEGSNTYGIQHTGGRPAVLVLEPGNVDFERNPNPELTIEVTDTAGNVRLFNLDVTVQDVANTVWRDFQAGLATSSKSRTGTEQDDTLDASRSLSKYSLYGGAGGDIIWGGSNNDHIDGGIGNDTMYGGNGSDHIFALSGSDTVYGGMGLDTAHLAPYLRPETVENVYFSGGFLVIEKGDTVVRLYNDVENINIAVPWVGNVSYTQIEYRNLFLAA